MARVVLAEIPWLHERLLPVPSHRTDTGLGPRQRAVLLHLVNGLSRSAIAERMGLSPHTVHDHVKLIYRSYRINSRAELVKKIGPTGNMKLAP